MRALLFAPLATLILLACDGRTTSALPHGRSDSGDTVDTGARLDAGPLGADGGSGPDRDSGAAEGGGAPGPDAAGGEDGGANEDAGFGDDAGHSEDTGFGDDAGHSEDTGLSLDADLSLDAGLVLDSGLSLDADVAADAGLILDADLTEDSGPSDAGHPDALSADRDGGASADAGRDASAADANAPYDGGRPADAGCAGPPGSADGGPLPVTRISFVSGSIDAVVDLAGLTAGDVLSVGFEVEYDNQTGGSERLCIVGASLQGLLLGGALPFDTDPWAFDLRTGRSTYRVASVPGSTPITDVPALAGVCGFPSQLVVDFSTGQQISAVILPECFR